LEACWDYAVRISYVIREIARMSPLVLFRAMRSQVHEVVVVRRTINLGYWEFGMGREWGGVKKGEVSL
jgi:hypothetical protein